MLQTFRKTVATNCLAVDPGMDFRGEGNYKLRVSYMYILVYLSKNTCKLLL